MFWVWLCRAWLARHCRSPCLDEDLGPLLAPGRGRRGVGLALGQPGAGEAAVEHAAGEAGRVEVVGQAHRGDGGQSRWPGSGHEHLGDPREGDPHHPHLVVGHPGLGGGDLHGVVAVVGGGQVEEVERPARAAGPPHLEADGGEAEKGGEQRADDGGRVGDQGVGGALTVLVELGVDEAVGRGDGVARLLDDRGERAVGQGLARREADRGRQRHPVPHGDVVEPRHQVLVGVEAARGRVVRWTGPESGPWRSPRSPGRYGRCSRGPGPRPGRSDSPGRRWSRCPPGARSASTSRAVTPGGPPSR